MIQIPKFLFYCMIASLVLCVVGLWMLVDRQKDIEPDLDPVVLAVNHSLSTALDTIDILEYYLEVSGEVEIPDIARGVAILGDIVFIAAGTEGLQVVDCSDEYNPRIVQSVPLDGYCTSVSIGFHRSFPIKVYVGCEGGGIYIVNVHDYAVTGRSRADMTWTSFDGFTDVKGRFFVAHGNMLKIGRLKRKPGGTHNPDMRMKIGSAIRYDPN